MDSVVFDGVTYVKASVAAKSFRYTSDYIGQLCRGKKVDARLVGRTWFVNLDSIKEHKQNKNKPSSSEVETLDVANEIKVSRVTVNPVVSNKTFKSISSTALGSKTSRTLKVSYNSDEEDLIPKLTRKHYNPPKRVRVELANSKKVRISGTKNKEVSFHPDELPDVALSGNLNITTYPDMEVVQEERTVSIETPNNKDMSDKQDIVEPNLAKSKQIDSLPNEPAKIDMVHVISPKSVNAISSSRPVNSLDKKSPIVIKSNFTPSLVMVKPVERTSTFVLLLPLIATFIAILSAAAILSTSMNVVVFESVYDSKIVFQMSNLMEILQR